MGWLKDPPMIMGSSAVHSEPQTLSKQDALKESECLILRLPVAVKRSRSCGPCAIIGRCCTFSTCDPIIHHTDAHLYS